MSIIGDKLEVTYNKDPIISIMSIASIASIEIGDSWNPCSKKTVFFDLMFPCINHQNLIGEFPPK